MLPEHKRPGLPVSAGDFNNMTRVLSKLESISGEGIRVRNTPAGIGMSFEQIILRPFIGRIVALGPKEEEDYTDERYWVKESITDTLFQMWTTAINLAESNFESGDKHQLEVGQYVQVWEIYMSPSQSLTMDYYFSLFPPAAAGGDGFVFVDGDTHLHGTDPNVIHRDTETGVVTHRTYYSPADGNLPPCDAPPKWQ